ncbi:MAG: right-handed parallel beta-helix repeat-containing protein, partial [Actinomycetia bacterium]|nr:right-handed parallel beta-helix repeat-containing protein [Actinomycetes bacterium]
MHDSQKSEEENGSALARAIQRLQPGEMLQIGPGRYSIASKFDIRLRGRAKAPIWIVGAQPDHLPVITRPDARQNLMNVGEGSRTEYVCFRGLELTGGSTLIRFYDCHHVWLDRCHLHHAGHEGITTNTRDTSHLFITRNHFHDFTNPRATGEAMYLGANHGKVEMSYSVIANNHVHHCGGTQGDGIEVKQGSHHNWIVGNHVHDTNYPCILVYGTGGKGINVIERNICYRSNDNTLQVQGEALIRNNLLIAAQGSGFSSTDHQGKTKHLTVVHNTIVSRMRGANFSSWNDREGMVFANNVVYTDGGDALRFSRGAKGVTISGNVVLGRVSGVKEGSIRGKGLSDFRDLSWDGKKRDGSFRVGSPAIGLA